MSTDFGERERKVAERVKVRMAQARPGGEPSCREPAVPRLRAPGGPGEGHLPWPPRESLVLYKDETRLSVFSFPHFLGKCKSKFYFSISDYPATFKK